MPKRHKKCPVCNSVETRKDGQGRGIQRYRCTDCGKRFSDSRREKKVLTRHLWEEYVFHKQTVRELAERYGLDRRFVREHLHTYMPPKKVHSPRLVHIAVDATYFGERVEGSSWCVVVARDHEAGEDLMWEFAETERTSVYRQLREELESLGYTIASVTGDGFGGIRSAFRGIAYQMCHVHMERIVVRGTTKNPQTEAGQVLLALVQTLHDTTKQTFIKRLQQYFHMYGAFLDEMTTNPITGKRFRTHKNLRSAAMSLKFFLPYLFTYSSNTHISKTTNSLEGRFSHINNVTTIHRGLSRQQKMKLIHSILLASTIAPDKKKLEEIL